MNHLVKMFPDHTRKRTREFSINSIFTWTLCFLVMFLLTLMGMFSGVFDWIDKACEDWKVQLLLVVVCLGGFTYWRFKKR